MSESALAVIANGLVDLLLGVHHERAMTDQGLVNRLSGQDQHNGVVVGLDEHAFAFGVEHHELAFTRNLVAVDLHRAVQHDQQAVPAIRQVQAGGAGLIQAQVPDMHGREGACRAALTVELTGDGPDLSGAIGQLDGRDIGIEQCLIGRVGHLVLGRQIDPQLHHLQGAAGTGERVRVKLLVHDAGAGRHPLHIAGPNVTTGPGGILVLDLAFVDDGDRLESAVRVFAHAARTSGRAKLHRAGMVEQQEWADVLTMAVVGKHRAHRKTVTNPVTRRGVVDTKNLFHDLLHVKSDERYSEAGTLASVVGKTYTHRSNSETMVMQDLNDLYYFAQVVDHGGFAPAGRALGEPKSKLSRRIAALEERLDARLLNRSTRHVSVTEIGRIYYNHCKAMLVQAEAAQDAIDGLRSEPCGTVRVSCPVALLDARVADMLADYQMRNPQVELHLDATNRRVDVIEEGFDIAIRVRPPPMEDSDLVLRVFTDRGQCLVASPELLESHGRPDVPADLSRLPSLALARPQHKHQWRLIGPDGSEALINHQPRLVTRSMNLMRTAAVAGVGVCQLPIMMMTEELDDGRLERVLEGWAPPREIVHAVFPSRRGLLPAVRGLIDHLAERFSTLDED